MFTKKTYISEDIRQQFINLRAQSTDALLTRSNDPGNFEENLSYLKKVTSITIQLQTLFSTALDPLGNNQYKVDAAKTELDSILYPDPVKDLFKREFEKEPRILKLSTNPNDNIYTIQFLDKSKLTLKSLENEEELAKAKNTFEEKMRELSSTPTYIRRQ